MEFQWDALFWFGLAGSLRRPLLEIFLGYLFSKAAILKGRAFFCAHHEWSELSQLKMYPMFCRSGAEGLFRIK
jgi:hypothetical protein